MWRFCFFVALGAFIGSYFGTWLAIKLDKRKG
jgi:uncharacterized membrane protein YfcA